VGWEVKTIGETTTIYNGGTPKSDQAEYWHGDVFWITPKDMGKLESIYVSDTSRKISQAGLQKSSAKLIPENSIILSTRAPIGHLAINKVAMATNQGCRGLVPKSNLDTKFLLYFLKLNIQLLNELGTGTTFKELSTNSLAGVKIPIPPLAEQNRIVGLLDEAFEGCDRAIRNTEKNLANARELFKSYLNAIFTQKGNGWVDAVIENHINFIDYRGRTPNKTEEGMRLITAKNVKMGFLRTEPQEFVDSAIYDDWMTRGIPKKGDVLFTTEAPMGNVAQLDTDEKVVFAQRVIIMQPDSKFINSNFLKFLLLSNIIQQRIKDKGTGATVQGIKASLLKKILISYPSEITIQKDIVLKLETLENETQRLEAIYHQKLAALKELKQSILQKAFTGELTADKEVA